MSNWEWLKKRLESYDPGNPDPNCWEWPWARGTRGYGYVKINGRMFRVHRVVASRILNLNLENEAELALHKCDNPPCFNPAHLEVGDQSMNMVDRYKNHCSKGHELTPGNVYLSGGTRHCRKCNLEWHRRKNQEKK